MYINQDTGLGRYQITGYDKNTITVGAETLTRSFVLTAETLLSDWSAQSLSMLTKAELDKIIALKPRILLIGTGTQTTRLSFELHHYLESHNIGVECMSTQAACRSYMALSSEGREVAALLFLNTKATT